jgi:dihydroxy-acid dehydratase
VGCGPRGGPGLIRLELLGEAFEGAGLAGVVLTDGLAPGWAGGAQISLFTPEATSGGVIGLLRDGDALRIDLSEGRIRTSVRASELDSRDPYEPPGPNGAGYAARYARSALSALEGAGFD